MGGPINGRKRVCVFCGTGGDTVNFVAFSPTVTQQFLNFKYWRIMGPSKKGITKKTGWICDKCILGFTEWLEPNDLIKQYKQFLKEAGQ